jgi:hypothetical protein
MKHRKRTLTAEQQEKSAERRARFYELSKRITAMTEEERAALVEKMPVIARPDGHVMSARNSMLIWSQKPDATIVAGFWDWKLYGRRVKKGASGIAIWVRVGGKKETEAEAAGNSADFIVGYVYDLMDTEDIDAAHPFERPVITPGLRSEWEKMQTFVKETGEKIQAAVERAPEPRNEPAPIQQAPPVNTALVPRLRALADGMQRTIDEKTGHSISGNWTARRQAESDRIRKDGYHLEKIQTALRALADAHEAGTVPLSLSKVNSKKAVEDLIWKGNKDLLAIIDGRVPDRAAEEKRRELETKARSLVGQIPGYFPTPRPVVERMIALARLQAGETVLEPEAGSGNIAEPVRDHGAEVDTVEWNYSLRELLTIKGFPVIGDDFLEMTPNGKRYDVVLMNPPFEKKADIDHIRHAVNFLKEGGRLVSVMGAGAFHNSDTKSREFRDWLSAVGGYDEELPAGSFAESGTGVSARLVVIEDWNS